MADLTFKIFRFDPANDAGPRFDTYTVPAFKKGLTVLESLYYIQDKLDGSLAFRASCREGICGSCAMHINGKYRLACETQVADLKSDSITIRPLGHLKVLRDLVVDMEPFFAKYKYIKPFLMPGDDAPPDRERPQTEGQHSKMIPSIDCILCACCHSSCTVTATDPEYLGPAALLWADRFVLDSRDNALKERLRLVDQLHGIWRCHTIFSCQEVCPKDLDPTGAIADLKRKAIRHRFLGR
ncbi:MAG: succinate dehydrogenase iron-sulfur subunit [Candidatus Abyssobacteria bacterium SURF_5]|uniref:Succinate dehydrogenase iron-sulfur subunit n=1 Tax=Abyssobacteria bacterium (strain SURF_5) TaxID=2093360 RepID=A0A3A4P446_ABYX5|nr:MAG: succinate dehydrogenase iron-sulfur subunit [Candidatus Abyssubacteria bacterium SURF_5]